MKLEELLSLKKIIVLLGPGGVGKTTSSVALALRAYQEGKKVGLLSIDPARRLAAALGIELSTSPKRLDLPVNPSFKEAFVEAAMIDQKKIFDQMVEEHSPNQQVRDKILAHPIYQAASQKLAGPLEYMALAQLQKMVESQKYDLIILDTPPDVHALDFLAKPNILAGFTDNKVMAWLIKPFHVASRFGVGKIFSAGEKLIGGMSKVTGLNALKMVAEFLVLIQQVIDGFNGSGQKILSTMKMPSTGFILVTSTQPIAAAGVIQLKNKLLQMGYTPTGCLVNKCLPLEVVEEILSVEPITIEGSELFSMLHFQASNERVDIKNLQDQLGNNCFLWRMGDQKNTLDSQETLRQLANQLGVAAI